MKLEQLKKKVIREFAKSPAKTIILIALCPVALYFVVPLVLPAKSNDDDNSQRVQVIAPNFVPSPTTPLASMTSAPSVNAGPTWQQLNGWIDSDWRRKPGTVTEDLRNPFQVPPVEVEDEVAASDAAPENPVAPQALSQQAFAALGLKLTGTLVGRRSRSATINGGRYLVGEDVSPMAKSGPGSDQAQAFVLKHIGARHVILDLDGTQFRLELRPARPLGNGITVVRRPAGATN